MKQVTDRKERQALFDVWLGSGPTKSWRSMKRKRKIILSKARRVAGRKEIKRQQD